MQRDVPGGRHAQANEDGCVRNGLPMRPPWIFAMAALLACPLKAMDETNRAVNISCHLGVVGRVNLGSYYTPAKYVRLVGFWLLRHGVGSGWTIADLSCGYGAFFELADVKGLNRCRYVGNDIDPVALAKARTMFPRVAWHERNVLQDVSRTRFAIAENAPLALVGNPPYNDVTSQINQAIKTPPLPIDADLRTRDLGMSSLLAYDKMRADVVAVLHPLSYLIKKQNFNAARAFFSNYKIVEHVVFPSHEFAGTSKTAAFPVLVALYTRVERQGLSYADVIGMTFKTTEGALFSLSGFDFITEEIDKYPGKRRYSPEILFYTLRDINALRRSRTFLSKRTANSVDVDPAKLAYYCYVDCFKHFAEVPYYLGNFNVPFIRDEFPSISNDVIAVSRHLHPDIFGKTTTPSDAASARVKDYVTRSIKGRIHHHAN